MNAFRSLLLYRRQRCQLNYSTDQIDMWIGHVLILWIFHILKNSHIPRRKKIAKKKNMHMENWPIFDALVEMNSYKHALRRQTMAKIRPHKSGKQISKGRHAQFTSVTQILWTIFKQKKKCTRNVSRSLWDRLSALLSACLAIPTMNGALKWHAFWNIHWKKVLSLSWTIKMNVCTWQKENNSWLKAIRMQTIWPILNLRRSAFTQPCFTNANHRQNSST